MCTLTVTNINQETFLRFKTPPQTMQLSIQTASHGRSQLKVFAPS